MAAQTRNWKKAGLSPETPALIVENASLPNERIVQTRLDLLSIAVGSQVTNGPTLLLIGLAVKNGQNRVDEQAVSPSPAASLAASAESERG